MLGGRVLGASSDNISASCRCYSVIHSSTAVQNDHVLYQISQFVCNNRQDFSFVRASAVRNYRLRVAVWNVRITHGTLIIVLHVL